MTSAPAPRARPFTFVFGRLPKAEPFTCEWCGKDKVSRVRVVGVTTSGANLTICNGCHGQLLREASS